MLVAGTWRVRFPVTPLFAAHSRFVAVAFGSGAVWARYRFVYHIDYESTATPNVFRSRMSGRERSPWKSNSPRACHKHVASSISPDSAACRSFAVRPAAFGSGAGFSSCFTELFRNRAPAASSSQWRTGFANSDFWWKFPRKLLRGVITQLVESQKNR